jgi:hypothetical protein
MKGRHEAVNMKINQADNQPAQPVMQTEEK